MKNNTLKAEDYNHIKRSYRPLPPYLIIKESDIHELGLFTNTDIESGAEIGITHVYDTRFLHNYIRTPLGGFYNHSETPNVTIEERKIFDQIEIDCRVMIALRKILKGEEIVAKYALYEINSTDPKSKI